MTRVLALLCAVGLGACSLSSLDQLSPGGKADAGPDAGGSDASTAGAGGSGAGAGGSGATDGGTQGVTCNNSPTPCTVPPPPSAQPPNTSGIITVIAFSKLFFGEANRNGVQSPTAWRSYGYNLDNLVSTATDANHCALAAGAPASVKTDGDGGIDNSFGANVVPELLKLSVDLSALSTQAVEGGSFTELIRLDNFLAPAQAPDQNGVQGSLFTGAGLGSPPLFDGTDTWPVTYESVDGGNLGSPRVTFPTSYVAGARWVSGNKVDLALPLGGLGQSVSIPIRGAVITMRVQGTGVSASAVEGTIAGVVDTEEFIKEFSLVATAIDPSLCNSSTLQTFADQIRRDNDIMSDGKNGDPGSGCDGISIGIGFDGFAARLGPVAPAVVPPPDPCP